MTYQELVECYPWIDFAWEVFKGISPTILGLVTVLLTEHFIKRRNAIDKRKEMQLHYLERILAWLHDTRRNVFEIKVAFCKALVIENSEDVITEYNNNVKMLTEMNESVFVWCDTYNDIAHSFGYDFKLEQLKAAINNYSAQITEIGKKRLQGTDINGGIDEMNNLMLEIKREMQESATILVETINSLYENRNIAVRMKRRMRIFVKSKKR